MHDFLYTPTKDLSPVVVMEDGGGLIEQYRNKAIEYRLTKRPVMILGSCRSACLLALSVPDVCVGPNAIIKAHHAYEQNTGKIRKDVTEAMMNVLPEKIKIYLDGKIERHYSEAATLSSTMLVSLGVKKCSDEMIINYAGASVIPHTWSYNLHIQYKMMSGDRP